MHGYKGDRKQFIDLAGYLQREGHAVLVPDLRWHGESTDFRNSDIGFAPPKNAIRKDDLDAMAKIDMEKFKKFLLDKNDAGELNIEKLCILGCDMGALVALNWAYDDWSWPPVGGRKQGQYVKALVLVSPPSNFKGYNATVAFKALADQELISFQILVGKQDSKAFQEAQRMRNALDRSRPLPKESREMTPEEKIKAARARSFWFSPVRQQAPGTQPALRPRAGGGTENRRVHSIQGCRSGVSLAREQAKVVNATATAPYLISPSPFSTARSAGIFNSAPMGRISGLVSTSRLAWKISLARCTSPR